MSAKQTLRRLVDLPGVADLEFKSVMKPAAQDPSNRSDFPEIDVCSLAIFGLTFEDAQGALRPDDWDDIEHQPVPVQVAAFEKAGWDVTDNKRRPVRMFHQFNQQLWLAVRGVAGALPFHAEDDETLSPLASNLAREAARFRRR